MRRQGGRGRPPAPPTRSGPAGRRLLATAVVALAALVATWGAQGGRNSPPTPGRIPPFDPGALTGTTGAGAPSTLVVPGDAALLFVDDECAFCREELRTWYRVSAGRLPRGLSLVRRPAPGVAHPGIVPTPWADRTLVDADGTIAFTLGVTAVPYLAVTDPSGVIVEVTLGLTPEERILELLETLAQGPGKDRP